MKIKNIKIILLLILVLNSIWVKDIFANGVAGTFFREIVSSSVSRASYPMLSKPTAYNIVSDISFSGFSLLSSGLLDDVGQARLMNGEDWVDYLFLSPESLIAAEMDLGLGFTADATWLATIVTESKRSMRKTITINTRWHSFLDASEQVDFLQLINNIVPDIMKFIQMGFQQHGKKGAINNFLISQRLISDVMAEGLRKISLSPHREIYDELNAILLISEATYYCLSNFADARIASYSSLTGDEIASSFIPDEYMGRTILDIVKDHVLMPWKPLRLIKDRLTESDFNVTPNVVAIFAPYDNALIRVASKYSNTDNISEEIDELLKTAIEKVIHNKKLLGLIPDEADTKLADDDAAEYLQFLLTQAVTNAVATNGRSLKPKKLF